MTFDIPKTQKAQIIHARGLNVQLEDIPVPEPNDDELLVHILYSGVCHSDVSIMKIAGYGHIPLPMVAGHEGAGVVVKMGKDVELFNIGDKVGLTLMNKTCQTCELCKTRDKEQYCKSVKHLTTSKYGTFQQYITVPALFAHKIPDGVELSKAAPLQCAGTTVYRALKETNARPGHFVAITGAGGGLGSFALQFAKAMGFRPIAIDFGPTKKAHCLHQGAEFFIDSQNENVIKEVLQFTSGLGAHAVVNIAPAIKPIEDALKYVRKTGTIVLVGLPEGGKLNFDIAHVVMNGLTIKGTLIGSREDVDEAVDFLARGLVDIPVEIIGLSELAEAIKRLDSCQVNGRLILDTSK